MTPLPGLAYFQKSEEEKWKDWRTWPHLGVGHDLVSECISGSHGCEDYSYLNYTKTTNFDHGAQRSVTEAAKEADCHKLIWLLCVS